MTISNHQLCQIRLLIEVNGAQDVLRAIAEIVEDAQDVMRIRQCAAQIKSKMEGNNVA